MKMCLLFLLKTERTFWPTQYYHEIKTYIASLIRYFNKININKNEISNLKSLNLNTHIFLT